MKKEIIRTIKDEESGKQIEITQGMIVEYGEAIGRYREGVKRTNQGLFDMILSIGRIIDKKLYLTAGYTNVESFAVEELKMMRTHAYNFYSLYKKLPTELVQRVGHSTQLPSFRRLLALPNDQNVLENLTKEDMERLAGLSDAEYEEEMAKLGGYDRNRDGGRGPADVERVRISRDRYRDQQKKIRTIEAQKDSLLDEKDELIGEIEKQEKLIEQLKKSASPDSSKDELLQQNKALTLQNAELQRLVVVDRMITATGDAGIRVGIHAIGECSAIFNRVAQVELGSHQQYSEFRVYMDCIRRLLDNCEDHVAFVMAEKSMDPKAYEKWHDGSFKYHMDKATEQMRKDFAEKIEKRTTEIIAKAKEERKQRKQEKESKADGK